MPPRLTSVVLFCSEPRIVALDGPAHYPVIAEVHLELVHIVLKGGRLLGFRALLIVGVGAVGGAVLVIGFAVLRRTLGMFPMSDLLRDGPGQQRDGAAIDAGLDAFL